jgi:hypothetical protein
MAPLAKRAGIVTLRRLQQIADYERTSNLITQISTRALAPRLTPEAMVPSASSRGWASNSGSSSTRPSPR